MAQPTSRAERFKELVGVNVSEGPSRGRTVERTEDSAGSAGLNEGFGQPAPSGLRFVPILAAAKFPYKYMSRRFSEDVSNKFFNDGKFWDRKWNLYFVWSSHCPDVEKPYVFIPLDQFKALIQDINRAFPSWIITIPADAEAVGLVIGFDDHPDLRPKWLGRSNSRDDHDILVASIRLPEMNAGPPPPADKVQTFQEYMEAAVDATRQKNKALKMKKKEDRFVKQQDMGRAFKRAQRYLGLHPRTTTDDELKRMASPELRPVEVDKSAPFDFDCDVIFIAVDAESFEHNHSIVTELGVATLDTRDLQGIAPGHNAEKWRQHIRARHFRIKEYAHYVNRTFIQGCENNFDFGTSESISIHDASHVMASCFKPPYSYTDAGAMAESDEAEKRNIIFLGHDVQQDVSYLKRIGYDIHNLSNLLETQDTSTMYRVFSHEVNPRNLGHICAMLDIDAWHMHNAGNDAVFTVQAMLGLCVKDAAENRGDAKLERSRERIAKLEEEVEKAKQLAEEKVRENAEGWGLSDDDDGGVPLDAKQNGSKGLATSMRGLKLTAGGRILDV